MVFGLFETLLLSDKVSQTTQGGLLIGLDTIGKNVYSTRGFRYSCKCVVLGVLIVVFKVIGSLLHYRCFLHDAYTLLEALRLSGIVPHSQLAYAVSVGLRGRS